MMHAGERPFKCKNCESNFTDAEKLKVHNMYKHEKKQFNCNICGKDFARNYVLKDHIDVVHSGIKKYSCDFCEFPTSCIGNKNKHMKNCKMRKDVQENNEK